MSNILFWILSYFQYCTDVWKRSQLHQNNRRTRWWWNLLPPVAGYLNSCAPAGVHAVLCGFAGFALCSPSLHSRVAEPLLVWEYEAGSSESWRSLGWTQRELILIHVSYLFTKKWSRIISVKPSFLLKGKRPCRGHVNGFVMDHKTFYTNSISREAKHQGCVTGNQKAWALVPGWPLVNSLL